MPYSCDLLFVSVKNEQIIIFHERSPNDFLTDVVRAVIVSILSMDTHYKYRALIYSFTAIEVFDEAVLSISLQMETKCRS